jgi:hypothetical protein
MLIDFDALRAANFARQAEWDPGDAIDLTFRANEMAGEVGAACNILKKLARERLNIQGSRATPRQLADELADIVICADLVAMGAAMRFDGEWLVAGAHLGPDDRGAGVVRLGLWLASAAGRTCAMVTSISRGDAEPAHHHALGRSLESLIQAAVVVAAAEDIDLWPDVVRKFNATSEANGLATRLPRETATHG